MITVTRKLLTEEEVREKLSQLARRYQIPDGCYDESTTGQMSDFDAMKWVSYCDQLKTAQRRRRAAENDIPLGLRSIYGGMKNSFESKEPENASDRLSELAA